MARLVLVHFCHGSIRMDTGMKRKKNGSAVVLSLRALTYTPERWDQFWWKVDRWGYPVATWQPRLFIILRSNPIYSSISPTSLL
jgi:hypothetical protein